MRRNAPQRSVEQINHPRRLAGLELRGASRRRRMNEAAQPSATTIATSPGPDAFWLDLSEAIDLLSRTPAVLRALLDGIPERLRRANEGPGSWSPFEIVGHLIHGEETDWIPRLRIVLEHADAVPFEPFDRFAHHAKHQDRTLEDLLSEFEARRATNLDELRRRVADGLDGTRPGRHPELGPVTLGQLLTTWVVHDLNHVRQIARVLAKAYTDGVGPWRAYLPVLEE